MVQLPCTVLGLDGARGRQQEGRPSSSIASRMKPCSSLPLLPRLVIAVHVCLVSLSLYRPFAAHVSVQRHYSDLSTVHIEKRFRCPPRRLFEALTDRREVMVSTQAPAVVEAKDGGVYSIYDGAIVGSFSGEPTQERIVLKWRMRGWAEDCTSTVELTLKARGEDGHSCGLTLNHTGIPATDKFSNGDQHRQVEAGWTRILDGVSKFLGLAIDKDDD